MDNCRQQEITIMNLQQKLKADLPASLVVFLVALPLCLGIAMGIWRTFVCRYYIRGYRWSGGR